MTHDVVDWYYVSEKLINRTVKKVCGILCNIENYLMFSSGHPFEKLPYNYTAKSFVERIRKLRKTSTMLSEHMMLQASSSLQRVLAPQL